MTTHLSKRGSRYYIRRKIPVDLQAHYGRNEIVRALGTSDPAEARVRCREEGVRIDREFAESRKADNDPLALVDWTKIKLPIETAEQTAAREDDEQHNAARDPDAEERAYEQKRERNALQARREAQRVDAYEKALRRVLDRTPNAALPSIAARNKTVSASIVDQTKRLYRIVERWEKERQPDKRTTAIMNRVVGKFIAMVGDLPVDQIARAHAVQFKDALLESGTSPRHTDGELVNMGTILNFAAKNLLAAPDVFRGIRVGAKRNAKAARLPFDKAALAAIFESPVFAAGLRPGPGGGEASYWLPLLAYTTGARLEELAQLAPSDIHEETYHDANDIERSCWVMRITDGGEGQGVKNAGSIRRFPLHAEILQRGFIGYCASQKGERLFPLLKPDVMGAESGNWSKWFSKYLRGICKVSDKRMVFHSFRHTFKDMARQAGIEESISDAMSGHVDGKVSRQYGGLTYPLAPLVSAVSRLRLLVTP